MDYRQELDSIEKKVNSNKEEKIKLTERQKHLQAEKDKIIAELKEMKIEEDELSDLILDLEVEIQTQIEKAKEVLG